MSVWFDIPQETRNRMRLAFITIEPIPDQADEEDPDEFQVMQDGVKQREGSWADCLRWVEWVTAP